MIGDAGSFGQELGKADAGDIGGNGFKIAANFQRGIGFGVKSFVLRRAAGEIEEDAGFGAAEAPC